MDITLYDIEGILQKCNDINDFIVATVSALNNNDELSIAVSEAKALLLTIQKINDYNIQFLSDEKRMWIEKLLTPFILRGDEEIQKGGD